MTRAVVYYRVSKGDQTVENQQPDCRDLVKARGWRLEAEIEETASGAKQRRVGWAQVLKLAHAGQVDRVVAWSLDRVARTLWGISDAVRELDRIERPLITVKEPWLDPETFKGLDPMVAAFVRKQMVDQWDFISAFERRRLIDRTMAGLAQARKKGNIGGRPRKLFGQALDVAIMERKSGKTWGQIQALLREATGKKLPLGTIQRSVQRMLDAA